MITLDQTYSDQTAIRHHRTTLVIRNVPEDGVSYLEPMIRAAFVVEVMTFEKPFDDVLGCLYVTMSQCEALRALQILRDFRNTQSRQHDVLPY